MMRRTTPFATAAVLVTAGLLLAGCAGGGTGPTTVPTLTPTVTVAPTRTPTVAPTTTAPMPAPQATIPTSCGSLASASTRQETVGDLTLQGDGSGLTRPAPNGATLRLGCEWIVGDATGLVLLISTAPPAGVTAAVAGLGADGYTCQVSDDIGAQYCLKPGTGPDTEETIVARDDVWIYQSTSNRNARAFLSEVVSGIFG